MLKKGQTKIENIEHFTILLFSVSPIFWSSNRWDIKHGTRSPFYFTFTLLLLFWGEGGSLSNSYKLAQ